MLATMISAINMMISFMLPLFQSVFCGMHPVYSILIGSHSVICHIIRVTYVTSCIILSGDSGCHNTGIMCAWINHLITIGYAPSKLTVKYGQSKLTSTALSC